MKQKRIRANLAIAGLDEGFAIACAGTHEAHCQRLLPALATESCGTLAGEQQYLVEHGFVQRVLSKVLQKTLLTHSPCTATSGDPLGSARVGDPFGAARLGGPSATRASKNGQAGEAKDSALVSQVHLQRDCFKVGPCLPLAGSRLKAATARQPSTPN